MRTTEELKEITAFIAEYATCLLGSGVHTSRVLRNSSRIGEAFGLRIHMTTLSKTIVLTVFDDSGTGSANTEVLSIPTLPISFEYNSELSALSWEAYDNRMPLAELRERYREIISRPKMSPRLILLLVGLANGAFCRLFGGSWGAVATVILATLVGIPMYADIFGTIPVAEALLAKGALLGTVLSFMMAVTTLSLPSLIMLRKAVRPRLLAVFVAICTAGILLVGCLFNLLAPYLI